MNYEIIKNESNFLEFIDWLPDLLENEKYYVTLFARRKYNETINSDKAQLKRFATTKELLNQKVKQLECSIGSYFAGDAPACLLYTSPSPRDGLLSRMPSSA